MSATFWCHICMAFPRRKRQLCWLQPLNRVVTIWSADFWKTERITQIQQIRLGLAKVYACFIILRLYMIFCIQTIHPDISALIFLDGWEDNIFKLQSWNAVWKKQHFNKTINIYYAYKKCKEEYLYYKLTSKQGINIGRY